MVVKISVLTNLEKAEILKRSKVSYIFLELLTVYFLKYPFWEIIAFEIIIQQLQRTDKKEANKVVIVPMHYAPKIFKM